MQAEQFRLLELKRGAIREGWFADIVIFDYNTIIDRATFDYPTLSPLGIHYVIINGALAVNNGSSTPQYSGRVLRFNELPARGCWLFY